MPPPLVPLSGGQVFKGLEGQALPVATVATNPVRKAQG